MVVVGDVVIVVLVPIVQLRLPIPMKMGSGRCACCSNQSKMVCVSQRNDIVNETLNEQFAGLNN